MSEGVTRGMTEQSGMVVVLGAGYGGLHVTQRLASLLPERTDVAEAGGWRYPIVLVDRRPYHQLTTELPRLVEGQRADAALDLDLRRLIDAERVQFVQAEVAGIARERRAVRTTAGELGYRFLVIALGSVLNDFGVAGVREHMRPFLTTEDAHDLRITAALAVEDAARRYLERGDDDLAALQRSLTVLIGGAGPTGVEVAGALAEYLDDRWEAARRVAGQPREYRLPRPRVILVEAG